MQNAMDISYNKSIGNARAIWLNISGGVIIPAMIKIITIAILLRLRRILLDIKPSMVRRISMIGIWKAIPKANISLIVRLRYSLILASRISGIAESFDSKLKKNSQAFGMTKQYTNNPPSMNKIGEKKKSPPAKCRSDLYNPGFRNKYIWSAMTGIDRKIAEYNPMLK